MTSEKWTRTEEKIGLKTELWLYMETNVSQHLFPNRVSLILSWSLLKIHTFFGVVSIFIYNPTCFRSDICQDIKTAQSTSVLFPGHEQDSRLKTAEWERQVEEVISKALQQWLLHSDRSGLWKIAAWSILEILSIFEGLVWGDSTGERWNPLALAASEWAQQGMTLTESRLSYPI